MRDAEVRGSRGPTPLGALVALALMPLTGCAHDPPPAVTAPPVAAAPLAPLPRACRELLPLGDRGGAAGRSTGELVRLLRRINPKLELAQRDCAAGDSWPIAYATGESEGSGKPPIGFEVLRMTGDALLTFDEKNRDAPTVNLCRVLDFTLGPSHRVRAVALWDSSDEGAFDAARPENSTATLAWVELLSREPSACALGKVEEAERGGDSALQEQLTCARTPLVLKDVPACGGPLPAAKCDGCPGAAEVEQAAAKTHRVTGRGRNELAGAPPPGLQLRAEGPELCLHEPAPAERDVCLAVYGGGGGGGAWYGRGDVTRTGASGVKNYVDSYLTFMLLRRIEAERKAAGQKPPAPAPAK